MAFYDALTRHRASSEFLRDAGYVNGNWIGGNGAATFDVNNPATGERLAAIDIRTPLPDVLSVVTASPYSRLPVYRGDLDHVAGMLHTKDVVTEYVNGMPRRSLATLLRPIVRVRHDMPADRLLTFLREHRSHQALVVDADGKIIGLITLEDVVAELLGGVADEFKMARHRPPRRSSREAR